MYVTRSLKYELKALNETGKAIRIWECETREGATKLYNRMKDLKCFLKYDFVLDRIEICKTTELL